MPRLNVPSRSRASLHVWPRVAVLALAGLTAAGCSDSRRFDDSSPFASNDRQAPRQQETTGSIGARQAPNSRVEAQQLPPPSQPNTVAAQGGYASGAQGLGAYRPSNRNSEVTGSVAARPVSAPPPPPPPPKPAGAWTWDGGAPVTVGHGEDVEVIARRYGVPASAIVQTNGFNNAAEIKPGQRLVIPRNVAGSAPPPQQTPVANAPTPARAADNVHVVQPGENLTGIAYRHGVSLAVLAKANNIQPYAKISMGDRLIVPGGRPVAARHAAVPQVAPPHTVPVQNVASAPVQNARVATQEPPTTETVVKTAEAAGPMPSFRWPVRGRIIAGFGPKSNGVQNDGINLAVPEGTPIKAADEGVVAYAGNELKGYGNLVLIRHSNGFVSAYAHASELLVKRGDTIKRGQVIAHAGQSGNVTSPQLHFEIRKGSTPVDPTKYLSGA